MASYKTIKGFAVQTLPTDPVTAGSTWSSGGAMNTGRYNAGSAGTQTAALGYGGYAGSPVFGTSSPPSGSTDRTEAYDGSSWTEVGDLNQFRMQGVSFGTQTAAIWATGISDYAPGPPYGRTTYTLTESWNGSSWTEVNNIPAILYRTASFGTSTAGITAAGAKNHPATDSSESYSWDGTNWTDGPNVNTPRSYQMGLGTSTAGMIVGGYIQSPASMIGNTEIWNGSAWTEVNDLNTARRSGGASKIGSTSEGIVFAGSTPPTTGKTEVYNGTSWSETADLATARVGAPGGVGIGTSALCFGGSIPGSPDITGASEEFSVSTPADTNLNLGQVYYNSTANAFKVTQNVDGTGSWASGGNMNTAKGDSASFGIQTAAIVGGGTTGSGSYNNVAESYNGSAWTSTPNLNTPRRSSAGLGTATAGYIIAGQTSGGGVIAQVEQWNGSSWTETTDTNTATRGRSASSSGTVTAAIVFGGHPGRSITESWNGSAWTEVNDMNQGRFLLGGAGTQTSALAFGGDQGGGGTGYNQTETWDGTSWTEVNNLGTARYGGAGAGSQSAALYSSGVTGSTILSNVESWNGTSWSEVAEVATAKRKTCGTGTSTAAIKIGGQPDTTATEEWNVPSSVLNQTITVG